MLDQMHDGLSEADLALLPSNVDLPAGWEPDTERPVPLATCVDDLRHFTRYKYRARAILSVESSLPAVDRRNEPVVVFTKDVSREGIAFYLPLQLFPRERLMITLPGQVRQTLRVARCRRINDRCYEVGARFE